MRSAADKSEERREDFLPLHLLRLPLSLALSHVCFLLFPSFSSTLFLHERIYFCGHTVYGSTSPPMNLSKAIVVYKIQGSLGHSTLFPPSIPLAAPHMYYYLYIHVYIYIYRERERESDIYIYIYMYTYIYIYTHTHRLRLHLTRRSRTSACRSARFSARRWAHLIYIYIYIYTHISYIYMHTYIHIYI